MTFFNVHCLIIVSAFPLPIRLQRSSSQRLGISSRSAGMRDGVKLTMDTSPLQRSTPP
ncbi:MAG: hypothetical protein OXC25_00995 [Thiotrichales bacterium]|nr:hypothetical protein [Thiotrichales bacterium]